MIGKLSSYSFSSFLVALFVSVSWTTLFAADDRPALTVAVNTLPRSLEPAERTGNVDVRVTYSIFDTLIRRDFRNPLPGGGVRLVPHLAESWKRLDGRTLEVKLRKGVKFHNGDELTADDVTFTFSPERLWGEKSVIANGRDYFDHLERVEKIDPYTVRFTTKKPDVVFEHRLSTYTSWVINARSWLQFKDKAPKDVAGKPVGKETAWLEEALKANRWNPVGTGPYKFKSWKKNEFVQLEAHDAYFLGKPAAKAVAFRSVPELATRIAGLVSGEFDIIVDVPPDQIPILDRYKDLETRSVVLENTHVLVFNTNHPVLKDKRIRQALSLAIDRNRLIKALWHGKTYTPNGHQLPSFGPMYNKNRPGYVYDFEKAKQLLKEAGYKGQTVSYRLIPNYYINGLEAAQVVQEMWKKIGFNVELQMVENFTQKRTPDAAIYAWSNSYRLPDPTGAIDILWGATSGIQQKYKYWTSKAFNDAALVVLTSSDMKERYEHFQKMLDIFEDEMPMTMLYNPLQTYGVRKKIDWRPSELFFMDFRPDNFKYK
jgi:peptide/nickel transport system substrate-binding protein